MFKRPIPRAATNIGAWLNIFQVLKSVDTKYSIMHTLLDEERVPLVLHLNINTITIVHSNVFIYRK
jgi:hypothetical protein